jgi:hypothetical protein
MLARLSRIASPFLLTLVLTLAPMHSQPLPAAPAATEDAAVQEEALTRLLPEVRIRKLHLVRPDLIPYPIAYETYC